MPIREQIVAAARSYLDVPWKHIGRSRQGLDCVGLLVRVAQDIGVTAIDTRAYTRAAQMDVFLDMIRSQTTPAPIEPKRAGQIALFRQGIYPMHVGILAYDSFGALTVVHAAALAKRVVEQPFSVLANELIEVRDFPGVED